MKNLISYFVIALSCLSTQISAYDNSCCPTPCDPCGNEFKGFYVGGNVGVGSYKAHSNDLDGFLTDNSGWSIIDTNVVGGVQLGYDWKCGNAVYGVVGDWNATGLGHTLHDNPNGGSNNRITTDLNWYSTIRARAGLAVNNALVYITAGAAVARFKTTWFDDVSFDNHDTRWGWTGGAGAEFFVCNNWTVGADVLFLHFAEETRSFTSEGSTFSFGHSDSAWVGRFFVNYRFGDLCNIW